MTCRCRLPWIRNRTCHAFDRTPDISARPGAASSGTSVCGVPNGRANPRNLQEKAGRDRNGAVRSSCFFCKTRNFKDFQVEIVRGG